PATRCSSWPWLLLDAALRGGVGLEVTREETRSHDTKRPVGCVTEHAEDGEDHEHAVGLHEQTRLLQQVTEAGVRGQDLGGNSAEVRKPPRQTPARVDGGDGPRNHHAGEDLELRRGQTLPRPPTRPRTPPEP